MYKHIPNKKERKIGSYSIFLIIIAYILQSKMAILDFKMYAIIIKIIE